MSGTTISIGVDVAALNLIAETLHQAGLIPFTDMKVADNGYANIVVPASHMIEAGLTFMFVLVEGEVSEAPQTET